MFRFLERTGKDAPPQGRRKASDGMKRNGGTRSFMVLVGIRNGDGGSILVVRQTTADLFHVERGAGAGTIALTVSDSGAKFITCECEFLYSVRVL